MNSEGTHSYSHRSSIGLVIVFPVNLRLNQMLPGSCISFKESKEYTQVAKQPGTSFKSNMKVQAKPSIKDQGVLDKIYSGAPVSA